MQFINPHEISGKILTLIEEAENELIIVSPYIKIKSWIRMVRALQKAVRNEVKITFVLRKNAEQKELSVIEDLGIRPILVDDLHAKLYINNKSAVVTSHNLYHYSDTNSIELGHYTEDLKEIKELKKFVDIYLLDKQKNSLTFDKQKSNISHSEFTSLKEWEVNRLSDFFLDKYPRKKITTTSSYIFSDDIVEFCDLMISGKFIIKLWRTNFDNSVIEKIEKLKFPKLNYEYTTEKITNHPKYIYLEFIPKRKYGRDKYFEDFLAITETLRNNEHKFKTK